MRGGCDLCAQAVAKLAVAILINNGHVCVRNITRLVGSPASQAENGGSGSPRSRFEWGKLMGSWAE